MEEVPKDLRALIEANPSKVAAILDHMRDLIQRFVDKGLLAFSFVHNLIWEYAKEICTAASTSMSTSSVETIGNTATTNARLEVICFILFMCSLHSQFFGPITYVIINDVIVVLVLVMLLL